MRTYELLYIIRPDLEAEQITAVVEKFKALLENNGAEITRLDSWGKRRLAYEVKDFREGYYVLVQFKSEPQAAAELDRIIKITEEVLKHLITRLDAA